MKLLSMFALFAASAAVALVAGCQNANKPIVAGSTTVADSDPALAATPKADPPDNLVCPITGDLISQTAPTRQWNDRTVGFSNADSAAQWDKLSDADKKTQFETAMNKQMSLVVNANCPMKGHPVSRAIGMRLFDGKVVGFCCAGCPENWDKLTDAQKRAKLEAAMK